jgi:hypothetical protein
MNRFVLSFDESNEAEAASLQDTSTVRVLDRSASALLLEGDSADVHEWAAQFPNSQIVPETVYPVQSSQRKIGMHGKISFKRS